MKKSKKLMAVLLAAAIMVLSPMTAFANVTIQHWAVSTYDNGPRMTANPIAAAPSYHPYMEQINALKLEPRETDTWGNDYYKRLYSVIRDDMTNFEKLWAVYDDVVVNYTKSANCVGYAVALECAIQSLGFETYHMRGMVTTVGGGWTEHSWVGVNVGGKLVYFDANLPGRYGSPTERYFGIDPQNAGMYKDIFVRELALDPNASEWLIVKDRSIPAELL